MERISSGHRAYRKVEIEDAQWSSREKESVSVSLFMEVNILEVEEELSTMATLPCSKGVRLGRWRSEQLKALRKQIFEGQTWRQVRGLAEAVMCEARDLGSQVATVAHHAV